LSRNAKHNIHWTGTSREDATSTNSGPRKKNKKEIKINEKNKKINVYFTYA